MQGTPNQKRQIADAETVKNELLPIRITTEYQPGFKALNFLQAADGTNISLGMRREWAEYISRCANQGIGGFWMPEKELGKVILQISWRGAPLDRYMSMEIRKTKNGVYESLYTKEFRNARNRIKTIMSDRPENNRPRRLSGDVHMVCIFVMSRYQRSHLSALLDTVDQLMFDGGLFSPFCYNIVKSTDGSEIVYSEIEDDWRTTVYVREWIK